MKRVVIFLHGKRPSQKLVQKYIKQKDTIICADGGAEYALTCGVIPQVIIGDNDSLSASKQKELSKNNIEWITYSQEKDFTDSELVINYAIEKGYKELLIFGAFGDRIDHFISNIFLAAAVSKKVQVTLFTEKQAVYFVHSSMHLSGKKGEYVSLISLTHNVFGITTTGLKYPLRNESLSVKKARGISNEFINNSASISLKKGILMVIHTVI